jgi:hypothetical protein
MGQDRLPGCNGFMQRLAARFGASMDRWHIAKRLVYVVLLGASLLIYYLLWSLEEALDLLLP